MVQQHKGNGERPLMPSEVTWRLTFFDRFASLVARFTSRAWFFAGCLLLVLIWAPSYFVIGDVDTWQLIINTATTIVTFLMVALLQNTQTRADQALQHKLNAIADGLSDVMRHVGGDNDDLDQDRRELREAVGIEERESA